MPFAPLIFRAPLEGGRKPVRIVPENGCRRSSGSHGRHPGSWKLNGNVGLESNRHRTGSPVGGDGAVLAALDLGTNNCRLLVARPRGDGASASSMPSRASSGWARGWRRAAPLRRGDGRGRSMRSRSAPTRCAAHGVARARSVATEACRRAANCAEFIGRVGARPASRSRSSPRRRRRGSSSPAARRCSIRAALRAGLRYRRRLDRAGLARAGGRRAARSSICHSLPHGRRHPDRALWRAAACRRRPMPRWCDEIDARCCADSGSDARASAAIAAGEVQMLGTSGTVTTLAGVHLELPRYDRAGSTARCWLRHHRPDQRAPRAAWAGRSARPSLHRARARRSRARGLRHPRGDLPALAGRAPARRRSRRARRHPARPAGGCRARGTGVRPSCERPAPPAGRLWPGGAARAQRPRARQRVRTAGRRRPSSHPLARAPAQRPLCRRGPAPRLSLARGLQADRARRALPSPGAGQARRRSRRGARRLDPDRGGALLAAAERRSAASGQIVGHRHPAHGADPRRRADQLDFLDPRRRPS